MEQNVPVLSIDGSNKASQATVVAASRRRRYPVARVKGGWTPAEDAELTRLVQELGEGNWSPIARALNAATGKDESNGRIGKQCRERWNHHLRPGTKKDAWTHDEEALLVKAHQELGNRWSDIAKTIPGRSENAVKNHWNATLRRRDMPDPEPGPLKLYMQKLNLIRPPVRGRKPTGPDHNTSMQQGKAGKKNTKRKSRLASDEEDDDTSSSEMGDTSEEEQYNAVVQSNGRWCQGAAHSNAVFVQTQHGVRPTFVTAAMEPRPKRVRKAAGAKLADLVEMERAATSSDGAAPSSGTLDRLDDADSQGPASGASSFGSRGTIHIGSETVYQQARAHQEAMARYNAAVYSVHNGNGQTWSYNPPTKPAMESTYYQQQPAASAHVQNNMALRTQSAVQAHQLPYHHARDVPQYLEPRTSIAGHMAPRQNVQHPVETNQFARMSSCGANTNGAQIPEHGYPNKEINPGMFNLDGDCLPAPGAGTGHKQQQAIEAAAQDLCSPNFLLDSDEFDLMALLNHPGTDSNPGTPAPNADVTAATAQELQLPALPESQLASDERMPVPPATAIKQDPYMSAPHSNEFLVPSWKGQSATWADEVNHFWGSAQEQYPNVHDQCAMPSKTMPNVDCTGRAVSRSGSHSSLYSSHSVLAQSPNGRSASLIQNHSPDNSPTLQGSHFSSVSAHQAQVRSQGCYAAREPQPCTAQHLPVGCESPWDIPAVPSYRDNSTQLALQQSQAIAAPLHAVTDGPSRTVVFTTGNLPGMEAMIAQYMPPATPRMSGPHTEPITLKLGSKGPVRVCLPELQACLMKAGLPSALSKVANTGNGALSTNSMRAVVQDMARAIHHVCKQAVLQTGVDGYLVALRLGSDTPTSEYSVLLAVRGTTTAAAGTAVGDINQGLAPLLC